MSKVIAATVAASFFNFADLSDLPEELAQKLTSDTDGSAREYAAIVNSASAAGYNSLQIAQVMAVAERMAKQGLLSAVPTENTVRNYLNRAVKLKLISKPTRASYGPYNPNAVIEADETDEPTTTEPTAPVAEETDPLAGIV